MSEQSVTTCWPPATRASRPQRAIQLASHLPSSERRQLFLALLRNRLAVAERVLRKDGQVCLRRRWQPPSSSFQLKSCCPAALLDKSADPGSSLLEFDELCRRVCLLLEFLYANRSQHADDRALGPIHGHAFVFQLGFASSNRLQHTFRQVTGCKEFAASGARRGRTKPSQQRPPLRARPHRILGHGGKALLYWSRADGRTSGSPHRGKLNRGG